MGDLVLGLKERTNFFVLGREFRQLKPEQSREQGKAN